MIERCFLEITNVCNLECKFCPGTHREGKVMTLSEFETLTDKLEGHVHFLYFHLMGEPLLNKGLPQFIERAKAKKFVPVLTTNGTLLGSADAVIDAAPYKIQISLHAHEGNGLDGVEEYMESVMAFAMKASAAGIIVVLRLWNQGGYNEQNDRILELIGRSVPRPWSEGRNGFMLKERLYLEYDRMFEWPSEEAQETDGEQFCYALRGQVGVLVDGTVVPCCLDHDADLALGNLFEKSLPEILGMERARRMYDGFSRHQAIEPFCRKCGYIAKTHRYRQ